MLLGDWYDESPAQSMVRLMVFIYHTIYRKTRRRRRPDPAPRPRPTSAGPVTHRRAPLSKSGSSIRKRAWPTAGQPRQRPSPAQAAAETGARKNKRRRKGQPFAIRGAASEEGLYECEGMSSRGARKILGSLCSMSA